MMKVFPKAEYVTVADKRNPILSKKFIQKAYVDMQLSRVQLAKYCGVTEKVFYNSYVYWFTPEERRKIGGRKISLAQSTKNSNKINTGKPRILITKQLLEAALNKRYSLDKMGRVFNVAPQTVRANLEYYGLAAKLVKGGVPYERVIVAKAVDAILGTSILKGIEIANIELKADEVKVALIDIMKAEQELSGMLENLRGLRRNIISRFNYAGVTVEGYRLPATKLNSTVKLILNELGFRSTTEFKLEGKFYDFKIHGYKLLIEIDSLQYHNTEEQLANDKLKTAIAEKNGYKLIRVFTSKDKKATLKKKIEACLKPLGLKISHQ